MSLNIDQKKYELQLLLLDLEVELGVIFDQKEI